MEERGVQSSLVEYALGKLEGHVGKEDTAEDAAESEEDPMILGKQSFTMKTRQAFGIVKKTFAAPNEPADVYLSPEIRYVREMMYDAATNGGVLAVVGESGSGKSTLREELVDRVKNESGKTVIIEPYTLAKAKNEANGNPMLSQHIAEALISTIAPGTTIPSPPEMHIRRLYQLLK